MKDNIRKIIKFEADRQFKNYMYMRYMELGYAILGGMMGGSIVGIVLILWVLS